MINMICVNGNSNSDICDVEPADLIFKNRYSADFQVNVTAKTVGLFCKCHPDQIQESRKRMYFRKENDESCVYKLIFVRGSYEKRRIAEQIKLFY